MKVEHVNPFLTATVSVFKTMLGVNLTRGKVCLKQDAEPRHEVSGIVGLSGKAKGTVVLSLCEQSALTAAGIMLGEQLDKMGPDVTDAVAELTNMIAGSAKAQLEHFAMSVSLPNIVTGKGHQIEFPTGVMPICIPFNWESGFVAVEVGLVECTNKE